MNAEHMLKFLGDKNHDLARVMLWVYSISLFGYLVAAWMKDPLAETFGNAAIMLLGLSVANYLLYCMTSVITNIYIINFNKKDNK